MNIRSALAYSFGTRYAATAVQFVSTLILARLLSPSEIGIYSVGASVIMIAHTLRDFGTSTYVIQEHELTPARLRTAFTLTVAIAWALALILYFSAAPLGVFYSEPGVALVMQVMAFNFALIPFGSISGAILRREMRFRALMYIAVLSTLVNSLSAVVFASLGFGFISLAWSAVLGTATTVIGNWIAERKAFLMWPSLVERRRVLAFSLRSSVSSIAAEAGHAAPDIVLGKTIGMEGTGLFSRALGYVQIFERLLQDGLRSVMLPYLSEQFRSGGDVRAKLQAAAPNIVSISLLIIGLTGTLADTAIAVLFGPQWNDAVPAAQLLCVGMALRSLSPTLAAAMVATEGIAKIMQVNLLATAAKFALLIALSGHGLTLAAAGFVGAEITGIMILLFKCRKNNIFGFRDYFEIMIRASPPSIAGCATAWLIENNLANIDDLFGQTLKLAISASAAIAVWFFVVWSANTAPKAELQRIFSAIKRRARKNR